VVDQLSSRVVYENAGRCSRCGLRDRAKAVDDLAESRQRRRPMFSSLSG
jgi:hypothetical protein